MGTHRVWPGCFHLVLGSKWAILGAISVRCQVLGPGGDSDCGVNVEITSSVAMQVLYVAGFAQQMLDV